MAKVPKSTATYLVTAHITALDAAPGDLIGMGKDGRWFLIKELDTDHPERALAFHRDSLEPVNVDQEADGWRVSAPFGRETTKDREPAGR